ncbi:MAG: ABC transporter substrate-binding protein [Lachnospiraceae bacterium]
MKRRITKAMKKAAALTYIAAVTVSCLTGCGSKEEKSSTAVSETAVETTPSAEKDGSTITNNNSGGDEAVFREVINVGIDADPGDLSPWGPNSSGRTATTDVLYENLAHCIDGEVYGVLMRDYELAEDESYMLVHLYDNIYDSAGNHLTASDVKFSFEKCIEGGNINGLGYIENVEVVDDYTAKFNFNTTLYVYDLETLFETFYVVTEAAYNASPDGMVTTPISTAPYIMEEYTSGYLMVMKKNENYWQSEELIQERDRANVGTINYYIITEASQMTTALENGSIDMSWTVSTDDIATFQEGGSYADEYWVFQTPDNLVSQLFANCTEGKATSNEELRKAIYYAIDSNVILESVYNGNGIVTYDTGRPKCPDYSKAWEEEENYYHYDLEKAKEHLAASGYKEGELTLKLLCEATDTYSNTAVLIQAFLSQIGINVEINAVDNSLLTTYQKDPEQWDLLIISKAASNYITTNWKNCFSQSYFAWGGTINFAVDNELEEKLNTARLLSTHTEESVQAVHEYIIDKAYGRGLVNFYNNLVIPRSCSQVVLSYKNAILPGACIYTE